MTAWDRLVGERPSVRHVRRGSWSTLAAINQFEWRRSDRRLLEELRGQDPAAWRFQLVDHRSLINFLIRLPLFPFIPSLGPLLARSILYIFLPWTEYGAYTGIFWPGSNDFVIGMPCQSCQNMDERETEVAAVVGNTV